MIDLCKGKIMAIPCAAYLAANGRKRCGHQAQSDWPLFGGIIIGNLGNIGIGQGEIRDIESYGLWTCGTAG